MQLSLFTGKIHVTSDRLHEQQISSNVRVVSFVVGFAPLDSDSSKALCTSRTQASSSNFLVSLSYLTPPGPFLELKPGLQLIYC